MSRQIIRLAQLASHYGIPGLIPVSPSTIWRWVRKGQFPRPFQLSPSFTAWNCDEITRFIEQKRLPLRGAK
jgi:predicted DNA-binding transcriptional regulator AlpA